jgi:RIO kinase 1
VTHDDAPLLEYDGPYLDDAGSDAADRDPDVMDDIGDDEHFIASNDEWAFRRADRLVSRIPGREGKDRRTEGEVFDRQSLLTLHKMLVHGVIKSLDFPVSTGKEANVFRGTTPQGAFVAVKIYRVNTATFKHVLQYIQGDERFANVTGDRRELVSAWAQKEFRNLHRLREAGVSVPEPIRVLNNVLVTEYIGKAEGPFPMLKDMGRLADPQRMWTAILHDIVTMVQDAQIVHADLSEYNVLVDHADEPDRMRPRIIDVGQAVLANHPMAREFLERDARNITSYFRRQGLKVTAEEVLAELPGVTG